jgi:transposase
MSKISSAKADYLIELYREDRKLLKREGRHTEAKIAGIHLAKAKVESELERKKHHLEELRKPERLWRVHHASKLK